MNVKKVYRGMDTVLQVRTKPAFSKRALILLASFLLPILLLIPGFVVSGIFPFGPNTTMAVDLRHEYVGFYEAFRHSLSEPGGFFYNWTKSLGGGMAGTYSYYLLSPLHFIFFLFSREDLPFAIQIVQCLKIGLAGLNFSIFLMGHEKGQDGKVVLFSTLYGVLSFAVAFMLNHMWLDVILVFPLVVLFLERLFEGKNPLPYALSLAYMILVNYYMAFMACLFLAFYSVFSLIRAPRDINFSHKEWVKDRFFQFARFLLYSLIGAGLAAVVLAPTLYSIVLSKGSYTQEFLPKIEWNYPPLDFFAKIIPGAFSYDQVPYGLPNIFVGSLVNILIIFYFFQKGISFREKLGAFFVLAVLYFSMGIDALNMIWHGMQHPLWYIYRYSWLMSFFMVYLAYRSFDRIRSTRPIAYLVTLVLYGGLLAYLYLNLDRFEDFLTPYHLLATGVIILVLVYLLHARASSPSLLFRRQLTGILALVTFVEMGIHGAFLTGCYDYESHQQFRFFEQALKETVDGLLPGENDFYRIEKDFQHDNNDGMRFGYPCLSHFNSDLNRTTVDVMSGLGFPVTSNSVTGSNPTKLTDGLFGLRYYLVSKVKDNGQVPYYSHFKKNSYRPDIRDMKKVGSTPYMDVYELDQALPLGLLAEEGIRNFHFGRKNPVDSQDMIANFLDGNPGSINYFQREACDLTERKNMKESQSKDNLSRFRQIEDGKEASLNYHFQTEKGASYYLSISNTLNKKNSKLSLNGDPLPSKRNSSFSFSQVYNVAAKSDPSRAQNLKVTLDKKKTNFTINNISLFRFNEMAWDQAKNFQETNGLKVTYWRDTYLEGSFQAKKNTPYLLLSIPYDEGWTFFVDGQLAHSQKGLDGLTLVSVPEGSHRFSMTYTPPYLNYGAITSALSLVVLLIFEMTYLRLKQGRKTNLRRGSFRYLIAYEPEEEATFDEVEE